MALWEAAISGYGESAVGYVIGRQTRGYGISVVVFSMKSNGQQWAREQGLGLGLGLANSMAVLRKYEYLITLLTPNLRLGRVARQHPPAQTL